MAEHKPVAKNVNLEVVTRREAQYIERIFPQVRDIWQGNRLTEALTEIQRWGTLGDSDEPGQMFFIREDRRRIGITGYKPKKNPTDTVEARLHGLIPDAQSNGYLGDSISLMARIIQDTHPERKFISDFVSVTDPDGVRERQNLSFLGFTSWTDPEWISDQQLFESFRAELAKLCVEASR